VTQFDDVTKMMSYFVFLKFYYNIINSKGYKLAKHATSDHQDEKNQTIQYFTNIVLSRARMVKIRYWEDMIALL